eukprot:comp24182_c0_seq1/m.44290 comp24182_c0_seq1/g.44290  ORF comp24182_c0_seq1/g.44290 comp24182_c0_seq1/m.44290 type:complete len:534 (-) comp24182_c0_seq1:388-1989(-)
MLAVARACAPLPGCGGVGGGLVRLISSTPALSKEVHTHGTVKTALPERSLLVGAHKGAKGPVLTVQAQEVDKATKGELSRRLALSNMKGKEGEVRVFHLLSPEYPYQQVAVAGLGPKDQEDDGVDPHADTVRTAVAAGVQQLRTQGARVVEVDSMGDAQAAGEGAVLGLHTYDSLKASDKRNKALHIEPHNPNDRSGFNYGVALGKAQNLVRELMETPSNYLTPTLFAERAREALGKGRYEDQIDIREYDQGWARERKMGAFLGVAQGSTEPLRFLEIEYVRGVPKDTPPVVLVGKGITFDSGGISIKPSAGMGLMRGDMGGAANVVGALQGLTWLGIKARVIGVIPLCENMPSGKALKPGDVITASNGLTIEVDNTDAEGRLILADALTHAQETHKPRAMLSIATLTGAIDVALGQAATGVFTPSDDLWQKLQAAGYATGERLWRMPLYNHYKKQLDSHYADLCNVGGRSAGSCTAAAFLRHFATMKEYAHLDIAGVMHTSGPKPGMACAYLGKGMQGRPVRAIVKYVAGQF